MLWEMNVSNLTCMKIEYIRLKHAKWVVWSFNKHLSHMFDMQVNSACISHIAGLFAHHEIFNQQRQ
ncbi:hypothetical protein LDENG_00084410 [Lucifuga dentata]|nr:hypothetical protein LDENG_00084410 [Lucifuga dentata]